MINLVNFVRFFKHLQLPAKTQRIRYNHLFVSLGIIKFFVLMKKMGETQVPFSYPLDLNRSWDRAGNQVYISFLDIFIKMPLYKISHDLIVCNKRTTSPNKLRKLWGLNAEYAIYIEDIQFKCCLSNFSPQYRSRIKSTPKIFKTWSCPLNGAMQYTDMWRSIRLWRLSTFTIISDTRSCFIAGWLSLYIFLHHSSDRMTYCLQQSVNWPSNFKI